jgi:20S proteasome alpha/beta subunit
VLVNQLSRVFCSGRGLMFCPTGLLVGGYLGGKGFLSVVKPNGEVETFERCAAIGIGAEVACRSLASIGGSPLPLVEAFEALDDTLTHACQSSGRVGGLRTFLAVASDGHVKFTMRHSGNNQKNRTHRRETLRRFALECFLR